MDPSLASIINFSIQHAQFPDILKVAKIVPIHKHGAKHEPSNYRPISILPVISISNNMFINILKTVYMMMGSPYRADRTVKRKKGHPKCRPKKLLGVIIDKNLS